MLTVVVQLVFQGLRSLLMWVVVPLGLLAFVISLPIAFVRGTPRERARTWVAFCDEWTWYALSKLIGRRGRVLFDFEPDPMRPQLADCRSSDRSRWLDAF